MYIRFIVFCMAISLFLEGSLSAQEYLVKYKFEAGKNYKYSFDTKSDVTQEVMGQEMKIEVNARMLQNLETEVTADGKLIIISSLDSALVQTKMPMRDTTIVLNELVGKREKIVLNGNGKIISKEMLDNVSGQNEIYKQVSSGLDKFITFPDSTIATGETWTSAETDTIEMMGGKIVNNADITYRLAGLENKLGVNCLKIELEAKNNNQGAAKIMGMDLTIEGTGKSKGVIYFDHGKGILIYTEVQVDNDMTMAATGEQNMIIPITQSTKSVQQLVK